MYVSEEAQAEPRHRPSRGTGRAGAQAEPGTKSRGMRDPRGFAYEPGGR